MLKKLTEIFYSPQFSYFFFFGLLFLIQKKVTRLKITNTKSLLTAMGIGVGILLLMAPLMFVSLKGAQAGSMFSGDGFKFVVVALGIFMLVPPVCLLIYLITIAGVTILKFESFNFEQKFIGLLIPLLMIPLISYVEYCILIPFLGKP